MNPANEFSRARYEHHHAEWSAARHRPGGQRRAARHLYALRAHLRALGWLAPEHNRPGCAAENSSKKRHEERRQEAMFELANLIADAKLDQRPGSARGRADSLEP
jgi:hypothetical protein